MNLKVRKVVGIIFIFLVMFTSFGSMTTNVYCVTNKNYGEDTIVYEDDLDSKFKQSDILASLGPFIYNIAAWCEGLVSDAFKLVTGESVFPWADRIIFNTIPFLDVNYINPSEGSLFLASSTNGGEAEDTILARIVLRIYYTVLILCVGLLGTISAIMAIKLAISSIASEKAKYKESMTKFLIAIILLFCMHYLISIIFYLNEKIVEVASSILTSNLEGVTIALDYAVDSETIVELFEEYNYGTNEDLDIISENEDIAAYLISNDKYCEARFDNIYTEPKGFFEKIFTLGDTEASEKLADDIQTIKIASKMQTIENLLNIANKDGISNDTLTNSEYFTERYKEEGIKYVKNKIYPNSKDVTLEIDNNGEWTGNFIANVVEEDYHGNNASAIYKKTIVELNELQKEELKNIALVDFKNMYTPMLNARKKFIDKVAVSDSTGVTLISDMGEYFKKAAWTFETDDEGNVTSWKPTQITVDGAILYAIFIAQSILFFFAYIKRFFYVVILALLAPAIVVYDYLQSALA